MKIKFLYLLLFTTVIIAGCNKCYKDDEYIFLTNDEKLNYQDGDSVIYVCSSASSDTFIVNIFQTFDFKRYEGNCQQKGWKYEVLYYKFINSKYQTSEIDISKKNPAAYSISYWCDKNQWNKVHIGTIELNGNTYSDIYSYSNDTAHADDAIVKLYFNKPFGVIYYERKNGNIWNLKTL